MAFSAAFSLSMSDWECFVFGHWRTWNPRVNRLTKKRLRSETGFACRYHYCRRRMSLNSRKLLRLQNRTNYHYNNCPPLLLFDNRCSPASSLFYCPIISLTSIVRDYSIKYDVPGRGYKTYLVPQSSENRFTNCALETFSLMR